MNSKCLYVYLREKNDKIGSMGSPYYVGEGDITRPYARHKVKEPKDTKYIYIKRFNLTKEQSIAVEYKWCKHWGLASQGGLLLNNHPGGSYPPNHKGMKRRPETIAKLKKSLYWRRKNPTPKMLLSPFKISRTNKKKGIRPIPINQLPIEIQIRMKEKMSISAKRRVARMRLEKQNATT